MKRRIANCVLLTLLLFTSNLGSTKQPYLTVCDVLTSPEKYEGKEVTIRGTYRVAFEASQLYSLSCPDSGPVWVEFENTDAGSKAAASIRKLVQSLGTVGGVFTGVFHGAGSYGHLGDYPFQFTVRKTEHLHTIDREGRPPQTTSRKHQAD